MPCGTTFVDAQGEAPRILSAEMPSHSLPLTQAYGPDTGRFAPFTFPSAVHLPRRFLPGFQLPPALCKCALRFDLRFIGLQQHHNAFFRACQGRDCISTVFSCSSFSSISVAQHPDYLITYIINTLRQQKAIDDYRGRRLYPPASLKFWNIRSMSACASEGSMKSWVFFVPFRRTFICFVPLAIHEFIKSLYSALHTHTIFDSKRQFLLQFEVFWET